MKRGFQFLLIHLVMLVAMVGWVSAQQNSDSSASADNPLVKLLQSKGIITEQEALMVNSASSRTESDERLARLLLSKGLISREEYDQTIIASTADAAGKPRAVPASLNAADEAMIVWSRSEEHTSELQSLTNLVCRLLLEKKKHKLTTPPHR